MYLSKNASQPIKEASLLSQLLEPTNEPYAIAKIAGASNVPKYNRQFREIIVQSSPTNLYGPGDNYHPLNSHETCTN